MTRSFSAHFRSAVLKKFCNKPLKHSLKSLQRTAAVARNGEGTCIKLIQWRYAIITAAYNTFSVFKPILRSTSTRWASIVKVTSMWRGPRNAGIVTRCFIVGYLPGNLMYQHLSTSVCVKQSLRSPFALRSQKRRRDRDRKACRRVAAPPGMIASPADKQQTRVYDVIEAIAQLTKYMSGVQCHYQVHVSHILFFSR